MIPKAVVFDLGKVLLDFDYEIAIRKMQRHCSRSLGDLAQLIDQSPLLYRFESGWLTSEDFFAEVKAATGFTGTLQEFAESFGDIFTPIEPMVELHASIRRSGVPTFVLSNTNDLAISIIRRKFPFFGQFDGYILSYEHGAMKPDPKLYEVVERASGRVGKEVLYIDDRPENVAAGSARGWRSILHEHPRKTAAAVRAAGLLEDGFREIAATPRSSNRRRRAKTGAPPRH